MSVGTIKTRQELVKILQENIIRYSIKCAQFLQSKNVKAIIIACNTASSYAYNIINYTLAI